MGTNQFIHFFFLTFLDEDLVISLTNEAVLRFHKEKNKMLGQKNVDEIIFIRVCQSIWFRQTKKMKPGFVTSLRHEDLIKQSLYKSFPLELDLWIKYHKSCRPEEMLVLIWSDVLQISEGLIAEALELSEGTIRYRLGRGLQAVGMLRPQIHG